MQVSPGAPGIVLARRRAIPRLQNAGGMQAAAARRALPLTGFRQAGWHGASDPGAALIGSCQTNA